MATFANVRHNFKIEIYGVTVLSHALLICSLQKSLQPSFLEVFLQFAFFTWPRAISTVLGMFSCQYRECF